MYMFLGPRSLCRRIADFYGTTCVPCKLFSKILEDIEAEIPFLNIVKLNTTDNPELAEEIR